jgi:REP element-mobilizing transposase RayT
MPWGLERWHGGHDLHFITFSCYGRQPLLSSAHRRELFLKVLEGVRRRYQWVVIGYIVMPEHVHILVSEPHQRPSATAIQALKLGFARRVLAEERRLRQSAEHAEQDTFGHEDQWLRLWFLGGPRKPISGQNKTTDTAVSTRIGSFWKKFGLVSHRC